MCLEEDESISYRLVSRCMGLLWLLSVVGMSRYELLGTAQCIIGILGSIAAGWKDVLVNGYSIF